MESINLEHCRTQNDMHTTFNFFRSVLDLTLIAKKQKKYIKKGLK